MTSHEPRVQHPTPHAATTVSEPVLRELLAALGHHGEEATIAALHLAVCDYVRAMRDAGHHPEVVLSRIKQLAAATLNDGSAPRSVRSAEAAALVSQCGQWCIAEYFRKG